MEAWKPHFSGKNACLTKIEVSMLKSVLNGRAAGIKISAERSGLKQAVPGKNCKFVSFFQLKEGFLRSI